MWMASNIFQIKRILPVITDCGKVKRTQISNIGWQYQFQQKKIKNFINNQ